jgi:hypothetical protein
MSEDACGTVVQKLVDRSDRKAAAAYRLGATDEHGQRRKRSPVQGTPRAPLPYVSLEHAVLIEHLDS